jgi:hypothetical protein
MEQFEVTSGQVHITDPCYDLSTWCGMYNAPAKNGLWNAETVISDEGIWGKRVAELKVWHSAHSPEFPEKLNADFGVDSGQMGVFDVSIYEENCKYDESSDNFYTQCCKQTLEYSRSGVVGHINPTDWIGKGFVTSSGYGDGSYNGYAQYDGNELVAIKIVFISDPENEDEVYDEDYDPWYENHED